MTIDVVKSDPLKVWRQFTKQCNKSSNGLLSTMKIGLGGTFTLDPLVPYIGGGLIQKEILAPEFFIAPFNQIFQLCFNPSVIFKNDHLDVIILLVRLEDLFEDHLVKVLTEQTHISTLHEELDRLLEAVSILRTGFSGSIIISTPPMPSFLPSFGTYDLKQKNTEIMLYHNLLNRWTTGLHNIKQIQILDLHHLLQMAGYENSHDQRTWYLYKQPYTVKFLSKLGVQIVRIIKAAKTSAKKCVVVDCDNTIWGGIIGEDGISGITLSEDFPGSAFCDFQKFLVYLQNKGIFLAIASRNNIEDVFEVFDTHDSMILSRDQISVFQVHWNSKVDSLREIAKTLNISTDALVFVDDNPKEITEVQERLPEVNCFQVPEELAYLPTLLCNKGLFDIIEITEEDKQRVKMMATEQLRNQQRNMLTEEDFLKSLELKVEVFEAQAKHLARVTQLVNKTNQFNLTSIRRTQDEIESLCVVEDVHVLAMEVTDRFGKYGIVGVAIICSGSETNWNIDTLLMSCRVLGRNIETVFLAKIAEVVHKSGGKKFCGKFISTQKNQLVKDLYKSHGFIYNEKNESWEVTIENIKQPFDYVTSSLRLLD